MLMTLTRDVKAPHFTLGKMTAGNLRLYTVEDAVREVKIPAITAIPFGKYKVIIDFSQHFQKPLPHLLDVPNFSGVRIHSGNTAADSEGCILVGTTRAKEGVANSRLALGLLMDEMEQAFKNGEDVWIEII